MCQIHALYNICRCWGLASSICLAFGDQLLSFSWLSAPRLSQEASSKATITAARLI